MKHAREDYNRIQDPENKFGKDEPVMLFRAQDKHFEEVLKHYRKLILEDNGDERIVEAVTQHLQRTMFWKCSHKQKSPDIHTPWTDPMEKG